MDPDNPVALRIALARMLRLPTENLLSFSLEVTPNGFPVVDATYLIKTADGLATTTQEFELRPVLMVSHTE